MKTLMLMAQLSVVNISGDSTSLGKHLQWTALDNREQLESLDNHHFEPTKKETPSFGISPQIYVYAHFIPK